MPTKQATSSSTTAASKPEAPITNQEPESKQTPSPDDPNIIYPYKNPDGTPIRDWWIKVRPLYTYAMQLRVNAASNSQVDGKWVTDDATATYMSLKEMVEAYRLPDFTRPGEELPPLTRDVFDTMPAYLINVMENAFGTRTGMDLSAWTARIAGKEADFRRSDS